MKVVLTEVPPAFPSCQEVAGVSDQSSAVGRIGRAIAGSDHPSDVGCTSVDGHQSESITVSNLLILANDAFPIYARASCRAPRYRCRDAALCDGGTGSDQGLRRRAGGVEARPGDGARYKLLLLARDFDVGIRSVRLTHPDPSQTRC